MPSLWSSLPSGDDSLPSFAIIYTHLRPFPSEAQPKPLLVLLDKPVLLSSTMLPKYPKAPLERKVCGSESSEHPRVSCSSFPKTQEILDLETTYMFTYPIFTFREKYAATAGNAISDMVKSCHFPSSLQPKWSQFLQEFFFSNLLIH